MNNSLIEPSRSVVCRINTEEEGERNLLFFLRYTTERIDRILRRMDMVADFNAKRENDHVKEMHFLDATFAVYRWETVCKRIPDFEVIHENLWDDQEYTAFNVPRAVHPAMDIAHQQMCVGVDFVFWSFFAVLSDLRLETDGTNRAELLAFRRELLDAPTL